MQNLTNHTTHIRLVIAAIVLSIGFVGLGEAAAGATPDPAPAPPPAAPWYR